jgi:hypothetical protein
VTQYYEPLRERDPEERAQSKPSAEPRKDRPYGLPYHKLPAEPYRKPFRAGEVIAVVEQDRVVMQKYVWGPTEAGFKGILGDESLGRALDLLRLLDTVMPRPKDGEMMHRMQWLWLNEFYHNEGKVQDRVELFRGYTGHFDLGDEDAKNQVMRGRVKDGLVEEMHELTAPLPVGERGRKKERKERREEVKQVVQERDRAILDKLEGLFT